MKRIPTVNIGDRVLWFQGSVRAPDRVPMTAIVNRVNNMNQSCVLSLSIITGSNQLMELRDGVRHIDDAASNESDRIMDGAWDLTDTDKEMRAWIDVVSDMLKKKSKDKE